jgi:hypothetical protein
MNMMTLRISTEHTIKEMDFYTLYGSRLLYQEIWSLT